MGDRVQGGRRSSAGAITATLVACGYRSDKIMPFTKEALKGFDSVPRAMAMVGLRPSLLDSDRLHDLLQRKIADRIVVGADGKPDYDPDDPPQCTLPTSMSGSRSSCTS